MSKQEDTSEAVGVRIDFIPIRDGYDKRISSMNTIEDQLEEMVSIGMKHLKSDISEDEIISLAIENYPHSLDDETPNGDDMQTLQRTFIFVITELAKAINENELRTDIGFFPYKAFEFSKTRESITFFVNGEAAGL